MGFFFKSFFCVFVVLNATGAFAVPQMEVGEEDVLIGSESDYLWFPAEDSSELIPPRGAPHPVQQGAGAHAESMSGSQSSSGLNLGVQGLFCLQEACFSSLAPVYFNQAILLEHEAKKSPSQGESSEVAAWSQARSILEFLAARGYAPAQLKYAQMLKNGLGGPMDLNLSLDYFTKAASQNLAGAQSELEQFEEELWELRAQGSTQWPSKKRRKL